MKIRKNALTAVIALLVITIIAAGFRFGMGMAVHSETMSVCYLQGRIGLMATSF